MYLHRVHPRVCFDDKEICHEQIYGNTAVARTNGCITLGLKNVNTPRK